MSTRMDERSRQRQFETQFLDQLRARALALSRGALPADHVVVESTSEGIDDVRDTLRRLEIYDRDALERLPGTQAMQIRFERSALGGLLRRTVSRLRARVLAPVEALASGRETAPVTRDQVLAALARYQVLPRNQQPSGVVLASPTGFTAEAARLVDQDGPPTLVLMGGRPDGGWDVHMSAAVRKSPWAKLFELESQDDRLKRVLYHLQEEMAALDSRGVPLPEVAQRLGLGLVETERLVRQACRQQPRLMTVVHNGVVHVCRSPLAQEGDRMSIWARIRKLLRLKPSVAERVREMTGQRVRLEQQRYEIDKQISSMEDSERQLLEQGAAAKTDAERKQYAGRLMRLRRDLKRLRSQANIYTQQIDVLGTHVHHLTLTEQGRRMELPRAEDLTREAAQAEQVMAELSANADLARSIEVTGETPLMAEEELAIFEEFKQAAGEAAQAEKGEQGAEPAGPQRAASAGEAGRAASPPARESEGGRGEKKPGAARPEIG